MIKIDDEVKAILNEATIEGCTLRLNGPRMQPAMYKWVDKVLQAAGGKWNKKQGVHVFEADPRPALGMALSTGRITSEKQQLQQFYTPDWLARLMVSRAGVLHGQRVLEPSAGLGAIATEIRKAGCAEPTLIDINPRAIRELEFQEFHALERDFLAVTIEEIGLYDAVVMNPPFTKDQDIRHVRHAFEFLVPGGTMVAITSTRWTFGTSRACQAFRAWVESLDGTWEALAEGTFRQAKTMVAAVMLIVRKPV